MKRSLTPTALVLLALVAAPVHAQYIPGPGGAPGYYPPVSPYLNLLRGGTDPAINYYGIVRPEIALQRSIIGLQQQVNTVGAQAAAGSQANYQLMTGHPILFGNYSHYFGAPLTAPTGLRNFAAQRPTGSGMQAHSVGAGAGVRPAVPR